MASEPRSIHLRLAPNDAYAMADAKTGDALFYTGRSNQRMLLGVTSNDSQLKLSTGIVQVTGKLCVALSGTYSNVSSNQEYPYSSFWDKNDDAELYTYERVGLGTAAPSKALHVHSTDGILLTHPSRAGRVELTDRTVSLDGEGGAIEFRNATTAGDPDAWRLRMEGSNLVLGKSNAVYLEFTDSSIKVHKTLNGLGSNLTGLNAGAVAFGNLDNARTTATRSNIGNTIVARDSTGSFAASNIAASQFVGGGSNLTGLNAGEIKFGTIDNARTTATSSALGNTIVTRDATGSFAASNVTGTVFAGSGSNLTTLNASQLTWGTLDNARTTATISNINNAIVARDVNGNFTANTVSIINALSFSNATRFPRIEFQNFVLELNGGNVLSPINKIKQTFNFTGADQTFTVPAGVSYIFAKLWGAGGGCGRAGGWSYGADGGGGGHSYALIPVSPGENLTVRVGGGGSTVVQASSFGGGGGAQSSTDLIYGGQGGGGTYIFRSSTPLLIAGGGGGGGSSKIWLGMIGGAGGGLTGQKGEAPLDNRETYGGSGGTQSAGGSSALGGAGSLYQGGTAHVSSYGGGGGGGYYGGGGGSFDSTLANTMGGGGGGSGFVASTCVFGGTFTGSFRIPAYHWDPDLPQTVSNRAVVAYGMQNTQNNLGANVQVGGNGICIIYT